MRVACRRTTQLLVKQTFRSATDPRRGFRIEGFCFAVLRVYGLGCRVEGLGFEAAG